MPAPTAPIPTALASTILFCLAATAFGASPAGPAANPATCPAASGPQRATLVELYTSEGCSSCPPADRWLSGFAAAPAVPGPPVVALAFHVDYWDSLGWRDRFASPAYTARQQARMRAGGGRFVYTPQTVVDGRDSSEWRRAAAPGRLPSPTPTSAGADLRLTAEPPANGQAAVHLQARLSPTANGKPAVAYLALYENSLVSEVRAGENAGRQLHHDFVVREWIGPLAFAGDGLLDIRHRFRRPDLDPAHGGIAAVIESADGTAYHQALALPFCR